MDDRTENGSFRQTSGCEVSHMPDGFVVYQVSSEKVHYLNPTAAMVYELCGTRLALADIVSYVGNAFSLPDPPVAEVEQCIDDLVKQGLVERC
jgi:hypothetical protein